MGPADLVCRKQQRRRVFDADAVVVVFGVSSRAQAACLEKERGMVTCEKQMLCLLPAHGQTLRLGKVARIILPKLAVLTGSWPLILQCSV